MIQQGPNPKDEFLHIKGDSRRYHRREKPLDPTTLAQGDPILVGIGRIHHPFENRFWWGVNRMFTGGTIWILTHGHINSSTLGFPAERLE